MWLDRPPAIQQFDFKNIIKWMDLVPENLKRLSSAQVISYVAKLSHFYIADDKYTLSISFRFSVTGFESNLVLEGEDSKIKYAPSSSILDGES